MGGVGGVGGWGRNLSPHTPHTPSSPSSLRSSVRPWRWRSHRRKPALRLLSSSPSSPIFEHLPELLSPMGGIFS
ncbi:MAG: hypothetical protein RMY29_008340 [Nostoc sp. CreGUA01]|nr:hypothetical protein [Nostoc sp. CreGUA01]